MTTVDPLPAPRSVAPSHRRVVVGVDGSESSVEALRWAGRIAKLLGLQIDAVMSWHYATSYGYAAIVAEYHPDRDAEDLLDITIKSAFGDERPDGLRAVVVEGFAARVLLDASEQAEMLVVGSRGHGGFVGLLIGSVSAQCVEHASCPVVVVRP